MNSTKEVRFSTDRNGRRLAHRWMKTLPGQGRWVKMNAEEADMLVAQGLAEVVK
jgi:hypothetical protein